MGCTGISMASYEGVPLSELAKLPLWCYIKWSHLREWLRQRKNHLVSRGHRRRRISFYLKDDGLLANA
jgi:hypothetical protein